MSLLRFCIGPLKTSRGNRAYLVIVTIAWGLCGGPASGAHTIVGWEGDHTPACLASETQAPASSHTLVCTDLGLGARAGLRQSPHPEPPTPHKWCGVPDHLGPPSPGHIVLLWLLPTWAPVSDDNHTERPSCLGQESEFTTPSLWQSHCRQGDVPLLPVP